MTVKIVNELYEQKLSTENENIYYFMYFSGIQCVAEFNYHSRHEEEKNYHRPWDR